MNAARSVNEGRAPATAQHATNVSGLLEELRGGQGENRVRPNTPFPTGMLPLDDLLAGGLRAHDLTLVGGPPAVGKTVVCLQWARRMAMVGATVVYVCYEHDLPDLLFRILLMEASEDASPATVATLDTLRPLLHASLGGGAQLAAVLDGNPLLRRAQQRMEDYAERLVLVRGSAKHTDLAALESLVMEHGNGHNVLMVDYLQKVPMHPEPERESDRISRVTEGLKELALSHDVAVVATVSAEMSGLDTRRIRLHHLRGSSALAYESDLVIMLNEKVRVLSKVHLSYSPELAEEAKHDVVFTIEKNRAGPAMVDMEFRKDFSHFRFEPRGRYVAERLVDDVITIE